MPTPAEMGLWQLARALLALPLFLLVPGSLLLRVILPPSSSPLDSAADAAAEMSGAEGWFLRLALSLGCVAWLAILLAEFGWFSVELLMVAVGASCLPMAAMIRPGAKRSPSAPSSGSPSGAQRSPSPRGRPAARTCAVAALVVLAAALYLPPYQTVFWASDSTVYLNLGRQIGRTGSFVFDDAVLADMSLETRRELFRNAAPVDVTGVHARFPGGFLIPDISEPRVTAGFSPLLPVLTAVYDELFGLRGALFVSATFAILGVCALYFVGARLSGHVAGVLAAGLLAVSLPQIWFARFGMPAVLAQFFVLAGVLTLALAVDKQKPVLAATAGCLVGLAIFAKFDLIVVTPVAVLSLGTVALLAKSRSTRVIVACFALAFAVPWAHNVAHFMVLPSHYAPFMARMLETSYLLRPFRAAVAAPSLFTAGRLVGVGLLLLLIVAVGVRARTVFRRSQIIFLRRPRTWGALLGVAIGAYAINYIATMQNRLYDTVSWLGWYLSWPVLALLAVGVSVDAWRRWKGRRAAFVFVVILLAVGCLHYLYDPREAGEQIWSIRRFVPVVIPLILLIVSVHVAEGLQKIAPRYRPGATTAVFVALALVIVRPSLPIIGQPLWAGAIEQAERVASIFPDDAMVLVSPEISGTHLQTSLTYLYDTDAILVPLGLQDPLLLQRLVIGWLEDGRAVFVVCGEQGLNVSAPQLALSDQHRIELEIATLETTQTTIPRQIEVRALLLRVFRVTLSEAAKVAVDVGTPSDDLLFDLRGFHGAERYPDPALGTYRWTSELATIVVPAEEEIVLMVDGGRPASVAPAQIVVSIGGRPVTQEIVVPNVPTTIRLANSAAAPGALTTVALRSSTFSPRRLDLSDDARELGVKLSRVEFSALGGPSNSPRPRP